MVKQGTKELKFEYINMHFLCQGSQKIILILIPWLSARSYCVQRETDFKREPYHSPTCRARTTTYRSVTLQVVVLEGTVPGGAASGSIYRTRRGVDGRSHDRNPAPDFTKHIVTYDASKSCHPSYPRDTSLLRRVLRFISQNMS